MKLLVLSSMYPNSVIYLSGIFVHEQVKQLSKIITQITVAAPVPFVPFLFSGLSSKWKKIKDIPIVETIDGIQIIHNRYIAIPNGFFKNLWSYIYAATLEKRININDFDIIHAHGSLPDDFAGYILSKKYNKPLVITVHGETVFFTSKNKRHFKSSKLALEHANAVVGVSGKVINLIRELTDKKKDIFKILNGYNKIEFNSVKENKDDKIRILFGGTIVERKGLRYLLNAFKILSERFDKIHLEIAGGGELLNDMKVLANDLNLNKNVTFYGVVEHKFMLQLMNETDIFILPSWNEAFGVVYLEAMSYGKPVIGTVGEGIEDIVKHGQNGLLVQSKSVDSIVENLTLLIENNELRDKIGKEGQKSSQEYTWENNAKLYYNLYEKILAG